MRLHLQSPTAKDARRFSIASVIIQVRTTRIP